MKWFRIYVDDRWCGIWRLQHLDEEAQMENTILHNLVGPHRRRRNRGERGG
jgi:hypothetical protein